MRIAEEVGGVALLIDAKSDQAAQWHGGYGAVPLLDTSLSLVLLFRIVVVALAQRTGSSRLGLLPVSLGYTHNQQSNHRINER